MMRAALDATLLLSPVVVPLALALGLTRRRGRVALAHLAPWAALPACLTAATVQPGTAVALPWVVIGTALGLDRIGQIFLLFTAILWWLSGLFAQGYLHDDPRRVRFVGLFLVAMSGNLGLILAHDAVTFYVCYSLMSFAAYGLVVHDGAAESLQAGRVYLALVVLGELLLFAAIVIACAGAGSLRLADVARHPMGGGTMALLLLAFGIKAGALPLHVWLPLAHPAAPVPASAVLSGAMIKAGVLGWIRFLPLGHAELPQWGALVITAGIAAAFYGALVGVMQRNPKAVLAYSSISQMGLITVPIGIGLLRPALWTAAATAIVIYALHHAFAKGALFLGVGAMARAASAAQARRVLLGLLIPALALIGAPYTSGAIAKAALKTELGSLPPPWGGLLGFLLPCAAIGTTLLMARFLWLIRSQPHAPRSATTGLWASWTLSLAVVAFVAWLLPVAEPAGREALKLSKVWQGLWPFAVGAIIAGGGLLCTERRQPRWPAIPAGDLLWPVARIATRAARRAMVAARRTVGPHWPPDVGSILRLDPHRQSARAERALQRWPVAGVALLCLIAILYALLLA